MGVFLVFYASMAREQSFASLFKGCGVQGRRPCRVRAEPGNEVFLAIEAFTAKKYLRKTIFLQISIDKPQLSCYIVYRTLEQSFK